VPVLADVVGPKIFSKGAVLEDKTIIMQFKIILEFLYLYLYLYIIKTILFNRTLTVVPLTRCHMFQHI
jgi:hypothetical protein